MNKKELLRGMRREFNKPVFALLIHYGIMNVVVSLVAVVQVVALVFRLIAENPGAELDIMALVQQVISNGWGYVLAYFISAAALLWWKKPRFCFLEIWQRNKPMKLTTVLILLCLCVACQGVYEAVAFGLSHFFRLFGLGIDDSVLAEAVDMSSLSMLVYAGIIGPIGEEILFRGLLLKAFRPYGKKFSILVTAILFGLFHGNLQQSVFAFVIGLLLGYVTQEYSLKWAVVLHIFNNLVLCYLLPLLLSALGPVLSQVILYGLIWCCVAGAAVILVVRRRQVMGYLGQRKIHPLCLKGFFSAPAVIVFFVLMGLNIVIVFFSQLIVL